MIRRALFVAVVTLAGCASTRATSLSHYQPARDLGPLFHDVQMAGIFEDSKTFVDAVPRHSPARVRALYEESRQSSAFSLRAFVAANFERLAVAHTQFVADSTRTMEAHIGALWPLLTRAPDRPNQRSTLIPLPFPYVVPGGRFREIYYWDSYFTMFGLIESGRLDLVRGMLDNFAHLINTFGHIPNGNRTYYLSRSQPPYFAAMISLYAAATDTTQALRYLAGLEREHAFWMSGQRAVKLPDGTVLNRYWDELAEPRPESYRADVQIGAALPPEKRANFYRNVRASAESGWDFSSRWLRDPADLKSLETIELAPIDLNSLLFHTERTIAALRAFRNQPGDRAASARYAGAAAERRRVLLMTAWDSISGFFYDVRWRSGERVVDRPSMAAAAPLYFGIATPAQAAAVLARLQRDFLAPGGLTSTLIRSGQQWDAPNGWAPLIWLGIQGACRYHRNDLAQIAADRWLSLNRRTYQSNGRMMEKYDVVDLDRPAGGGEYPTQDGFGWTNGVALALAAHSGVCRAAA
jgi:alpha,alpha-trehalase